jgi:F-type H+-transporting ATPase subunit b
VLKAVVTQQGSSLVQVRVLGVLQEEGTAEEGSESGAAPKEGPSPIAPELKELAWGSGSFIVFALLMRYFLFPRLKSGMDARYNSIQSDHESADQLRTSAQREVADYQAELSGVRAEAAGRVDAVRQTLESERTAKLGEVNAGIAKRKAAATAEADAAREAVRSQIESAVGSVASRAVELATGKVPSASAVSAAVSAQMSVGASQ